MEAINEGFFFYPVQYTYYISEETSGGWYNVYRLLREGSGSTRIRYNIKG